MVSLTHVGYILFRYQFDRGHFFEKKLEINSFGWKGGLGFVLSHGCSWVLCFVGFYSRTSKARATFYLLVLGRHS